MLGHADDAEDALSEVFLRFIGHLRRLDGRRPLRPWLRRVMVNECLSRLRCRRRELRALDDWGETGETPGPGSESAETVREVRRALGLLPPRQRAAIVLVGFGGNDLKAAAGAMGCSVGALKSHLHRARARLRTELGDILPKEGESGELHESAAGT